MKKEPKAAERLKVMKGMYMTCQAGLAEMVIQWVHLALS